MNACMSGELINIVLSTDFKFTLAALKRELQERLQTHQRQMKVLHQPVSMVAILINGDGRGSVLRSGIDGSVFVAESSA